MVAYPNHFHKYGGWLPSKPEILSSFIEQHVKLALAVDPSDTPTQHLPAVQEFKEIIQGDAVMKDLFDQIFLQVSKLNKVSYFGTIHTIYNVTIC